MPESSGIKLPSLPARLISHASLDPVSRGSSSSRFLQRLNWVRELDKALDTGIMSSQSFLPLSSPPESPRLMPRQPSLDPEREILSTRGQRILSLLPSRLSSSALQDLEQNTAEPPTFLRRGSQLIGHSNARYEWYAPWR